MIAHKSLEYPNVCRSMLTNIEEEEDALEFDIQKMLDNIRQTETTEDFEI